MNSKIQIKHNSSLSDRKVRLNLKPQYKDIDVSAKVFIEIG